ncbi:hypothetical protein MMC26_006009 [Xylographa opegraphella]|nr:hypothetical protein [Xylographa opegraphella]
MSSTMDRPNCHVLIIGAGLCGLGAAISIALAGHQVSVFESAPQLHPFGAGIQITPNGVRVLRRWGVAEELVSKAATPESLSIIRYDGQKVLAYRSDYGKEIQDRYGEPIWCLHRVDLQRALARRAEELGVHLNFNSRVCKVDFETRTIFCENGRISQGDLVIAADGLWSSTRSSFFGRPMLPQRTGDLAYRIVLTADQVEGDEELRNVITRPGIRIWMGPRAHAVAYSLLRGQMLNIVLLVPDDLPHDIAKAEGDLGEMAKLFEGWDPLLIKFLSHVKKVDKWRLMYLQLDEQWRSEQGEFIMAGDACHTMLPYLAQGANSALEDSASIGTLLGKIDSKSQVPEVTRIYQETRKERVLRIREETFRHQEEFHLADGELQETRDRQLAMSFEAQDGEGLWTHPKIQPWLFGYDACKEAERAWDTKILSHGMMKSGDEATIP